MVIYPYFTLQFCYHSALPRGKLPNVLLFAMKLYLFLRSSCAHSCPTWPSACPWAAFDALMNGQLLKHCTDAALSYRLTHFEDPLLACPLLNTARNARSTTLSVKCHSMNGLWPYNVYAMLGKLQIIVHY